MLFGFKGTFVLVSVDFDWSSMPEHRCGADGSVGVEMVSVEVKKWKLTPCRIKWLPSFKEAEHDVQCFQSSTTE